MKHLLRTAALARRLLSAQTAVVVDLSTALPALVAVDGEPLDEGLVREVFARAEREREAWVVTVEGTTALGSVFKQGGLAVFKDGKEGWLAEDRATLAELTFVALAARLSHDSPASLLYQTAAQHLPNTAIMMFDANLRYVLADGPSLLASVGLSREEMIGRTVGSSVPDPGRIQSLCRAALNGQTQSIRFERDRRTFAVTAAPVRDGDLITHGLLFAFDDTERSKAELDVQATLVRDGLTGLLNRRGLLDSLGRRLKGATGQGALIFVDVDMLKQVNDLHGHAAGDEVIKAASSVLRSTMSENDLVGRLGGDEFAVFASTDAVALVARMRAAAAADPVLTAHGAGLSIGFALCSPGDDVAKRLAEADRAMYADKRQRRASRDSNA